MKVQRLPIGKLKPNPANPRLIKDDKFKKLVASIRSLPAMLELRPIVVNADLMVLGGNMRLKACQAAGLKEVPVVIADELTEAQQAEFVIKDNVNFGEWEWDTLANAWDTGDLTAWGLDVPFNAEETEMPALPESMTKTIEQMTFTVTADQADTIREAIAAAIMAGAFVDTGNENKNGNGLARLAEVALGQLR
jgi:hypothetical protein